MIILFAGCVGTSGAQSHRLVFGLNTGYEFASAYFEKNEDIPFKERLSDNYSIGLMMQLLTDSSLINISWSLYYKFRSFKVDLDVDDLDPNYNSYLETIIPEYYIIGMPVILNWDLVRTGNFVFGVKSGMGLEFTVFLRETSEFSDGKSEESDRLIPYSHNKKVGVPFILGIGADWILDKKIKIGLYPMMNLYMKKFNPVTESGYSSVFGLTFDIYLL